MTPAEVRAIHTQTVAHLERCAACRSASARITARKQSRRMTADERTQRARDAAKARWAKEKRGSDVRN